MGSSHVRLVPMAYLRFEGVNRTLQIYSIRWAQEWRQYSAALWAFAHHSSFRGQSMLFTYHQIQKNTSQTVRSMLDFLGEAAALNRIECAIKLADHPDVHRKGGLKADEVFRAFPGLACDVWKIISEQLYVPDALLAGGSAPVDVNGSPDFNWEGYSAKPVLNYLGLTKNKLFPKYGDCES